MKNMLLIKLLIVLYCIGSCVACNSQSDTVLIDNVKAKLQGKTTISAILADPGYADLHSTTAFRNLIKEYATNNAVTIITTTEPGRKIRVIGKLLNEKSEPVVNALIYFYQTDARGWYLAERPHVGGNEGDRRHARLFGYLRTDKNGQFEIHTVKPSGYPQSDLPAHIHIEINELTGYRPLITEFLFDDDERLVGDRRQQSLQAGFINSVPEKSIAPFEQQFSYSIVLKK